MQAECAHHAAQELPGLFIVLALLLSGPAEAAA